MKKDLDKQYNVVEKLKTVVKLKASNGKIYSFPKIAWYHLLECKNRTEQKLDGLVIVTGATGSGKSNFSIGFAGAWEDNLHGRQFTLDNVHFLPDKVVEKTNEEHNLTEAIDYDEAIQGATTRDGISKIGFILRKALITKRRKRHLYLLNVDEIKELTDKVIERAVAWYHFYYIRDKNGKYRKGLFKVFSPEQALKVYDDLKNKKYRKTIEHPIFYKNWKTYSCPLFMGIWFNEDEYDKKKSDETNLLTEKASGRVAELTEQRNRLIVALLNDGKTQYQVAKISGLSRSAIGEVKNMMPPPD